MKCLTGETYRMSSSAARVDQLGVGLQQLQLVAGARCRASRPPAIAFEVVSWPAVAMMT